MSILNGVISESSVKGILFNVAIRGLVGRILYTIMSAYHCSILFLFLLSYHSNLGDKVTEARGYRE